MRNGEGKVLWGVCAAVSLVLAVLWVAADADAASAAASVLATVIAVFGALSVWSRRRSPGRARSDDDQLTRAQEALARLVRAQWREEARLRGLYTPLPLPVTWSDSPGEEARGHVPLIGGPVSCQVDRPEELAAVLGPPPLPRRLVVLGPAGSGKTTFAVLLALALLDARTPGDPVPVLLTAASFDPDRENGTVWLRRRVAADYPSLTDADAYGPSALDDLLEGHRILPVIDGLDELPESARQAALLALKDAFDPSAPLVLTCRTEAFRAAAAGAGPLVGAPVIEPAALRAADSFEQLRLATAAPSRTRWDRVADHLRDHPDGALAQALTSPLNVALARTVYAEGTGDPSVLLGLATREAVEDHLLDAVVPVTYERARRRDPGRRHGPGEAHRHLTRLARGMARRRTYDLAWWRLHDDVPTVARAWSRATVLAGALVLLTLLGCAVARLLPGVPPPEPGVAEWYAQSAAAAVWCVCLTAAWIPARPAGAALGAALAGLAFAVPGMTVDPVREVGPFWYAVGCVCVFGFSYLLVLHPCGLPAPPPVPSRGTLAPAHRSRRLARAALLVAGTTLLTAVALWLYGLVVPPTAQSATRLWTYGLGFGVLFGTGQALLYFIRGTTTADDRVHPAATVRADRLFTLVSCCAAPLFMAMPCGLLLLLQGKTQAAEFVGLLLGVGPTGLVLALAARAWPYYTAARLLLATRGLLPWRLQAFLDDAHRLGVLRQVGPVYQFRHARLQERLAHRAPVPAPRPDTRPTPAPFH
ncbi:NACHT domain-containing protein [Streptomyces sp. NPDC057877]|uniref:NACHT domain-containing protein n=1 Tax=Streptomyces sp. NPDC057877 TaxID=3346269 RepID=UPI0036B1766A